MYNLRSTTLEKLEKLNFGEKFSNIKLTLDSRSLSYHDNEFDSAVDFNFNNGLSITLKKDVGNMGSVVYDGVEYDISKWLRFENFPKLSTLMSDAFDVVRGVDIEVFNAVKSIFDTLVQSRIELATNVLKETNSGVFGVVLKNKTGLISLSGSKLRDGQIAYITIDTIYEGNAYSNSISTSLMSNALQVYNNIDEYYNAKLSDSVRQETFQDAVTMSFTDIEYTFIPLKESEYDFDDVLDERPSTITYRSYYGSARDLAIPLSFFDMNNVSYVFCSVTNQPIMKNHSGSGFAYDLVGNSLNDNGYYHLSNRYLENFAHDSECDRCGDVTSYLERDVVDEVLDTIPEEHRHRVESDFEYRYNVVGSEWEIPHLCNSCQEHEDHLNHSLEEIGGSISGSTLSYGGNDFDLDDDGVHSYDYKPYNFDLHHFADETDNDLHLGVELEIDKGGENNFNANLIRAVLDHGSGYFSYAMHDGSLDDGFEIATMPSTLAYHQSVNYADAFKLASELGYRSHDTNTCGLHVHMNRRFFGASRATQNIKAAFMALILERNWEEVVKFSRRNYHHIEEWANKQDFNEDIDFDDDNDSIAQKFLNKYDEDKYVALNTQHNNSFELRIFRGTLNYKTYIATLQFVSNLAHISKSCTTLTRAQQISFDDIVNYKSYAELNSYLATRNLTTEGDR